MCSPTMIDRLNALALAVIAAALLACACGAAAQTPQTGSTQILAVQRAMGDSSGAVADMSSLPVQAAIQAQSAPSAALRSAVSASPQAAVSVGPQATAAPAQPTPRLASGLQPFGARLFAQGDVPAALPLSDGQHVLAPGDDVRVMIWGGYSYDAALKIQKDGSVFLPFAGVMKLAGLRESELAAFVQRRVATVFTGSVHASAALLSANPVRVYVTGYAGAPGIYEGYPGEGVFAFLKRAGGVDAVRGAYTDIKLLRGGQPMAVIDLYELLANGRQPALALQSGDTIHVALRGPTVQVRGMVNVEAEYELGQPARTLGQLATLAGADVTANQARIERITTGVKTVELLPLSGDGWRSVALQPGDAVHFGRTDRTESIYVRITGEHEGASELILPRGATLADALARIEPNGWSRLNDSYVVREDIRQAQIAYKSMAARQIEQTILRARSASIEEARLRKEEADLLLDWVKRLERYDVRGALVAASESPRDVFLSSGDVIDVPSSRAPVYVVGDVFNPIALQQASGFVARDYLRMAGVDTDRSELRYFIQRPNGVVRPVVAADAKPEPGDQIFVLPEVDSKKLQGSKDILQIIYQLAVSAKIIFGL